jgi:predicted extracellular nuclease
MKKEVALGLLLVGALVAETPAAIIISQYYEGASNNKYIELFNSGNSSVDLAAGGYQLSHWSNANREIWKTDGAPTGTQALTGSIAAGGTYLIAHTSAAAPAYALPANQSTTGNGGVNFNGDDSVAVWTGTTYAFASVVDAFGVTGNTAQDTSFVRNVSVTTGTNADFNAAQWTQFTVAEVDGAAVGTNERLNSHAVPEPAAALLAGMGTVLAGAQVRRRKR